MKNVTITLDAQTAAWARAQAAAQDVSLSRFVSALLRERMRQSQAYDEAYRAFVATKPVRLRRPGERWLAREEAHARAGVRRR